MVLNEILQGISQEKSYQTPFLLILGSTKFECSIVSHPKWECIHNYYHKNNKISQDPSVLRLV